MKVAKKQIFTAGVDQFGLAKWSNGQLRNLLRASTRSAKNILLKALQEHSGKQKDSVLRVQQEVVCGD